MSGLATSRPPQGLVPGGGQTKGTPDHRPRPEHDRALRRNRLYVPTLHEAKTNRLRVDTSEAVHIFGMLARLVTNRCAVAVVQPTADVDPHWACGTDDPLVAP